MENKNKDDFIVELSELSKEEFKKNLHVEMNGNRLDVKIPLYNYSITWMHKNPVMRID